MLFWWVIGYEGVLEVHLGFELITLQQTRTRHEDKRDFGRCPGIMCAREERAYSLRNISTPFTRAHTYIHIHQGSNPDMPQWTLRFNNDIK